MFCNDVDHVRCVRAGAEDDIESIWLQVITVPSATVQTTASTFNLLDGDNTHTIARVDMATSMANGGALGVAGAGRNGAIVGDRITAGLFTQQLESVTSVRVDRGTPRETDASVAVQVIDW